MFLSSEAWSAVEVVDDVVDDVGVPVDIVVVVVAVDLLAFFFQDDDDDEETVKGGTVIQPLTPAGAAASTKNKEQRIVNSQSVNQSTKKDIRPIGGLW